MHGSVSVREPRDSVLQPSCPLVYGCSGHIPGCPKSPVSSLSGCLPFVLFNDKTTLLTLGEAWLTELCL